MMKVGAPCPDFRTWDSTDTHQPMYPVSSRHAGSFVITIPGTFTSSLSAVITGSSSLALLKRAIYSRMLLSARDDDTASLLPVTW